MAKEDRTIIRERHGIANARKIKNPDPGEHDVQTVTVGDGAQHEVIMYVSSSDPTALTPEQAEMLAQQLIASATRVRANKVAP